MSVQEGQRFGRWIVLDPETRTACHHRGALVRCDCGSEKTVAIKDLFSGRSTSCGCRKAEVAAEKGRAAIRLVVRKGQRFGRWTVLDPETRDARGFRAALVRCDCGNEKITALSRLVAGNSTSCGCKRAETNARLLRRHGLHGHLLYGTHRSMMRRCHNPADSNYPAYGGSGVSVYEPWHDVANFIAWVEENLGPRPDGHSLDRIDPDGNYEPGNVRWADAPTQRNNQRLHKQAAEAEALRERVAHLESLLASCTCQPDRGRGHDRGRHLKVAA